MVAEIIATLYRTYTPNCTYGIVHANGKVFTSLELPWLMNKKAISCIPEGTYKVVMGRMQARGEDRFQIMDVPAREGVFIHAGNTTAHTQGCPLLGYILDVKAGVVGNSQAACKAFETHMPKTFTLIIKELK